MLVVEPRRGGERHEKLAAVGVGPRVGHREHAGLRVAQLRVELVGELVARPTRAGAERAPALQHECVNHAMERQAVVKRPLGLLTGLRIREFLRAFGEPDEISDRVGNFLIEQPDFEIAFARGEQRMHHRCRSRPSS